jgi:hypothetical protein
MFLELFFLYFEEASGCTFRSFCLFVCVFLVVCVCVCVSSRVVSCLGSRTCVFTSVPGVLPGRIEEHAYLLAFLESSLGGPQEHTYLLALLESGTCVLTINSVPGVLPGRTPGTCVFASVLGAPPRAILGHPGPSWAILGHPGPSWAFLGIHWPSWAILDYPGPSWAILGHPGPSWGILGHPGPSWAILGYPGPSWAILALPGSSWALLGYPGPSWAILGLPGRKEPPGGTCVFTSVLVVSSCVVSCRFLLLILVASDLKIKRASRSFVGQVSK